MVTVFLQLIIAAAYRQIETTVHYVTDHKTACTDNVPVIWLLRRSSDRRHIKHCRSSTDERLDTHCNRIMTIAAASPPQKVQISRQISSHSSFKTNTWPHYTEGSVTHYLEVVQSAMYTEHGCWAGLQRCTSLQPDIMDETLKTLKTIWLPLDTLCTGQSAVQCTRHCINVLQTNDS